MNGEQPIMSEKPYSQLKGDDKRWRADEGAGILRRYAELMKDKDWLAASKKTLEEQIKASQKALNYPEMDKK